MHTQASVRKDPLTRHRKFAETSKLDFCLYVFSLPYVSVIGDSFGETIQVGRSQFGKLWQGSNFTIPAKRTECVNSWRITNGKIWPIPAVDLGNPLTTFDHVI